MERVREILNTLPHDGKIAIGVSGGIDSMCLLHFVLSCEGIDKSNVLVVNIEHGIRGEDSVSDSEFVENYCKTHGVGIYVKKLNVAKDAKKSGRSIETEARLQRKAVFDELLHSGRVSKVLLAHHADDQAETILMHIFRGSGLNGIKGMSIDFGGYLRPFLPLTRREIEEYAQKNDVPYVVDKTNFDINYNRNFVRNEVLPLIKKRWTGVENALIRLSEAAAKEEKFISSLIDPQLIVKSGDVVFLKLEALQNEALAPHYILKALKDFGVQCDFETTHINAVLSLKDLQNGKSVCVVHGVRALREYDRITFLREKSDCDFCLEFAAGSHVLPFGELTISPCECIPQAGKLRINADAVPDGAVIRNRKEGDIFKPYGGGSKKLKSYFIDKKVPSRIRDTFPLIAFEGRILAICGIQISDDAKLTSHTKRALEIDFRPFKDGQNG